ncbi:MAG: metal ABC transporter ATP-binding protein [Verrucomicrobia bacterium]|nr:metal ABC transporter ATP-binding protein [Verrucomicrobiota bacterium]
MNSMTHHLEIKDLTVAYHRVPAVHHVTLDLHCGHCVALLGPNGAGKTTFFKALVGLVPKETGEIIFGGHGKVGADTDIAYLPQRSVIDWDFPITVRGMVEMGRYMRIGNWRHFGKADDEAVDVALHTMDLAELADRQISALSGGQQQRAFLARSLAQEAHVFLLDEPFTGLDKTAQDLLGQAIQKLAADGNLVIASHHDLKSVPELFDQVIFLNGELIAFGDTDEMFREENIARTYRTHIFSGTHAHDAALIRST